MALLGCGAGAWAFPGDREPEKQETRIEKRRIVIVGPDGKEKVIEGLGPMVRRGFLGVSLSEMTPELRTHFGAPEDAGVMVSSVEPGSPADKGGLEVGDIISRLDGKDVSSSWEVYSRTRGLEEGQQVTLEVWRDGKVQTHTVSIALRERPELDMGPLFGWRGEGEGSPMMLRWNKDLGSLPERLELPPPGDGQALRWVQRERTPRERELEKKLQDLEKRIADLEKQLGKKER
jgi:hypothetical protein